MKAFKIKRAAADLCYDSFRRTYIKSCLIALYVLTFRTPVMVVSAGVKSILDIGLTLEYLETMGVCVTTFGLQVIEIRDDIPSNFLGRIRILTIIRLERLDLSMDCGFLEF